MPILRRRVRADTVCRSTRRKFLIALGSGALAGPLACVAQQLQKVHRIGILSAIAASGRDVAFMNALREFGYVEGKNSVIERRYPEGNVDRLSAFAVDLVQQKVDVIFAPQTVAAAAAKRVTQVIPIVFAVAPDPVGSGLVTSLPRPGGNVTGTSSIATELSAKRLQILKEAFPKISRVAVFTSSEPIVAAHFAEVQRAAKVLGMEVLAVQLRRRGDSDQVFALIRKWGGDSVYVIQSSTNFNNRELLAEFAARTRLPAIFPYRESAEAGGLVSYGANFEALYQRAATYVDRILKGAKPADLPVEQPTTFELVINMKAAIAIGIRLPQELLLRANKVIE